MEASKYIDVLKKSLSKVEKKYFKLTTTYELHGIVRERVFCYELYHQIRKHLGENDILSLNGEIDKRGNIDFEKNDQKNPDFVFHVQGENKRNTLVVEVKGKIIRPSIQKDFRTLLLFVEKYNYTSGAFVLYNHNLKEFMDKMNGKMEEFRTHDDVSKINILCQNNSGAECESAQLKKLFDTGKI